MQIKPITDPSFRRLGKVFAGVTCEDMIAVMEQIPIPDAVKYYPSIPELEATVSAKKIAESLYGCMPVQVGYCAGHNNKLNAFEYHRDAEVSVACTDLILLLGFIGDVTDEYTYDTSLAEAFFVPKGTVFETFGSTLHYAPCGVDGKGFANVVCLPKGTNTPLPQKVEGWPEDKLLLARNKWVIAHKDGGVKGAFVGLVGENVTL